MLGDFELALEREQNRVRYENTESEENASNERIQKRQHPVPSTCINMNQQAKMLLSQNIPVSYNENQQNTGIEQN